MWFPWVGTAPLQHLGHNQGNSTAAQLSSVPSAASSHAGECFPVLQSFPEHLTQEANGLNLVLFRVVIPEAYSPWEVKAVSQPDCSLSCPSCCSLSRSWHFEIMLRPAFSPAIGKMFFLCVFPSSFPSKPLLMAVLLP